MAEIIGVRFKQAGRIYYFDPNKEKFSYGENVVVETARGVEFGEVALDNRIIDDEEITAPLKPVIRRATEADFKVIEENKEREKSAYDICLKKIANRGLKMKLVSVEYAFDRNKIIFYFTADGRIDFRELVKDLAAVFRTRIELRQIGVRDESKIVGGLGVCGRPFCCKTFLGDFQPVSVRMAKEQGLSLSPVKISGTCGRLMCCLKYEQDAYEHLLRVTPKNGAIVDTPEGKGTVISSNILTGMLTVRLDKKPDAAPLSISRKEVRLIKDSKIKVDKKELEEFKNIE
ncbi:MAG: stage 0 sporulation family protein [Faecalibacterium sp.]|nr:stage 0 sporulation family protein [Ruminococcus sp.]MCM1486320.1 stage 0 sporulation family protein [Faecalibacterium sp.]